MTADHQAKQVIIDPRDFITGPYRVCPKCGNGTLGLLTVTGNACHRRCRACFFNVAVSLPAQQPRKLIYLDQFAISDIAKRLYTRDRANERVRKDVRDIWRDIFVRLNRLCQLGVIACPSSPFHDTESEASPAALRLRRLLTHLSGGLHFRHHHELWNRQVRDAAKRWAAKEAAVPAVDPRDSVDGSLTAWRDKITIDLMGRRPAEEVVATKQRQDANHDGFLKCFEVWKSGPANVPFDVRFAEFVKNYGWMIALEYKRYIDQRVASGVDLPVGLDYLTRSHLVDLFMAAHGGVLEGGIVDDQAAIDATLEFLVADGLQQVPYVRVKCGLLAALQQKAAAGQKKPPTRGIMNDILAIASYAPYCDAIIVDNQCRGMLVEKHMERYRASAETFSFGTREEFVTFLAGLERAVTPEHRALYDDVYGDRWTVPFLELLDAEVVGDHV